jgi:beta-lactamase class A
MLKFKVNFSILLLSSALCSGVTYLVNKGNTKHVNNNLAAATVVSSKPTNIANVSCGSVSHRLEGYKYIKPLLWGDKTCESGNYAALKAELVSAIDKYKQAGVIDNCSVYMKVFSKGEFVSINENDMFHPGSLIKLPILITYLSMEEKNAGVLNRKLTFNLPPGGLPQQTYNSNQIQPGKSYTIKELLRYMIAFSDNNATYLLNENVDLDVFKKMYVDFGMPVPDVRDRNYQITAKDYSAFLKVIYNAGYLTINNSEYVAELLHECDFNEGIASGLPKSVEVAHKFGEWGDVKTQKHQLSESAIVYLNSSPYLITVMTSGADVKKLPAVISEISKLTYNKIREQEVTF